MNRNQRTKYREHSSSSASRSDGAAELSYESYPNAWFTNFPVGDHRVILPYVRDYAINLLSGADANSKYSVVAIRN